MAWNFVATIAHIKCFYLMSERDEESIKNKCLLSYCGAKYFSGDLTAVRSQIHLKTRLYVSGGEWKKWGRRVLEKISVEIIIPWQ